MADEARSLTTAENEGSSSGAASKLPAPLAQLKERFGEQALRKAGLIAGLVASIAAGVLLFVWAQEPTYRPLYGKLAERDAAAIVEALKAAGADYRLDPNSGEISVPAGDVAKLRLHMASQGLPEGSGTAGFESLQKEQGFGTSQFMENARFQRALETELARSISSIQVVESARVHLAVPKQSVFIRERDKPTASVVVNLVPGRSLTDGQVAAIVHMVASSVPELLHENVTVVDQRGRLLSRKEEPALADITTAQLEFRQTLEDGYVRRIENLLAPMFGANRVRAQVSARLNFAQEESTQEVFDPERSAVRSEQLNEQRTVDDRLARGVPGALTNQPPQAGTLLPGQIDPRLPPDGAATPTVTNESSSATRNYEITKTIRHSKAPVGTIERLSVAVLVDQKIVTDADGNVTREPMSQAELDQIAGLVREAVGLDATRGDSINVISAAFQGADDADRIPWHEQPRVWEAGKLLLVAILGLVLLLKVIAPIVRSLLGLDKPKEQEAETEQPEQPPLLEAAAEHPQLAAPEDIDAADESRPQLPGLSVNSYEDALTLARQVVSQEPAVAASVVKNWLAEDER